MGIGEIVKDAIAYPTNNIKALLIYLVLGLLVGVVTVLTGISGFLTFSFNFGAGIILGIIGIVLVIAIYLLMLGFSLDIIKFGIKRSSDAPELDFKRQISNGLKYIIVGIVYLIIPTLFIVLSGMVFQKWIVYLIGIILAIIFSFALVMAICRLADTEDLLYSVNVEGAIADLRQIGVGNVVITIIVATIVGLVIVFALSFILAIILSIFNSTAITSTVVPIVSSILDAWLLFYLNRSMGLLYSNK